MRSRLGSAGVTLIELMLFLVVVGVIVAAVIAGSWRPFAILLFVFGGFFALLTCLAVAAMWRFRISLPRQLRALDALEQEGQGGADATFRFAKVRKLLTWVPMDRGLPLLRSRISREGPFREQYLRLVEAYLPLLPAREFVQSLADGNDPLAQQAREMLASHPLMGFSKNTP